MEQLTMKGRLVELNWAAVAEAVRARREEVYRLTQFQVVELMGEDRIGIETYRQIERGEGPFRRSTLAAVARVMGWPDDYLWRLATGESPAEGPSPTEVVALTARLDQVEAALEQLEQRTADLARTNERLAELLARLVQRLHPDDTAD